VVVFVGSTTNDCGEQLIFNVFDLFQRGSSVNAGVKDLLFS
jgi:hypothetical protein